jgi:multidrug transporter EmrE-like cation transporter
VTQPSFRFSHRQNLALVFLCTLTGAAAQYFIKVSMGPMSTITLMALITNIPLWFGLTLYGLNTILMVLALRDGELSLLYPVISLTFVWVAIISKIAFNEPMNGLKIAGITTICLGVALLGQGKNA